MNEKYTVFVVQFWVERYEYWQDAVEPSGRMFDVPKSSYETFDEASARYEALRGAYPGIRYQLIERTTTQRVLVAN